MPPDSLPGWVRPLFVRLATPRLPGSEAVAEVEEIIAQHLTDLGLAVSSQPFRTSARRLHAGSILGAGLGWVALALVPLFLLPVSGWIVGVIGTAALGAVSLISAGIATGALPLSVPTVEARNIIASRASNPVMWLVAHSDSKTQSISLKTRALASLLTAVSVVAVLATIALRLFGPVPLWLVGPPLLGLLAGSALLSRPALVGGSPGAVDNASGVIAALRAAELLRDRPDVGVLITGAEEFGMEGARAWIMNGAGTGAFVNFDGIDASGTFNVMQHRRGSGSDPSGLHGVLCGILAQRGYQVRRRALPFGVFVDGAVLAKGGLGGVTLSRGTWETLAVVHTVRDTVERTDPAGAAEAGAAAAEAIRRILG